MIRNRVTCEVLSTGEFRAVCTCAGLHTPDRAEQAAAVADARAHAAKTGHQLLGDVELGSDV